MLSLTTFWSLASLEGSANPKDTDPRTCAAWSKCDIHEAVARDRKEHVTNLLKEEPSRADSRDFYGATPLHWACIFGQLDSGSVLIGKNATVNLADDDGVTPLMECARHCTFHGSFMLLRMLLMVGADPSRRSAPPGKQMPWRLEMTATEMAAAAAAEQCVAELAKYDEASAKAFASDEARVQEAMSPGLPRLDITALDAAIKGARRGKGSKLSRSLLKQAKARLEQARQVQQPLARWLQHAGVAALGDGIPPRERGLLWRELENEAGTTDGLASMEAGRCAALVLKHTPKPPWWQRWEAEAASATQANATAAAAQLQEAAAVDALHRRVRATLEPALMRTLMQVGRLWVSSGVAALAAKLGAQLLDAVPSIRTVSELSVLDGPELVAVLEGVALGHTVAGKTLQDGPTIARTLGGSDALKAMARQLLAQAMLEEQHQQQKQQAAPAAADSAASTDTGAKPLKEPKLLDNAAKARPRDEL